MTSFTPAPKKRGRPPKRHQDNVETRQLLLHAGLELLTERGFAATGLEAILKRVQVPKGSFYHYFDSKEAFGLALIDHYAHYFLRKLKSHLNNTELEPLARISAFVNDAQTGMARHDFKRGCLIGNLGQEMGALPESFRSRLIDVFEQWQAALADCLRAAVAERALAADTDCDQFAHLFWVGWEGAVLRAKLEQSGAPLQLYHDYFLRSLPR